MKYDEIVELAEKCIDNTVNKHTASVNYTQNYTTNAYIFSKSILNIGKAISVKKVPVNPKPQHSVINGGIGINNIKKLCQLMVNWVDQHGEAPAYLAFDNGVRKYKIGIDTWAYATARVVKYYSEKKKLPNKIIVTSKIFDDEIKRIEEEKRRKQETERKAREEAERKAQEEARRKSFRKYGRSREYGCDNRGQNNGYYCGPHMVQEIIRNLTGVVISQDTLASVIGTTSSGSDHDGINTSFAWFNRNYDYTLEVSWKNFSELGWDGVKNILESNNQDCGIHELYRDQYGHYTNFDEIYNDTIDVHNSLGDRCSGSCYCGYTENRSKSEARSYIGGISQKSVIVVTRR